MDVYIHGTLISHHLTHPMNIHKLVNTSGEEIKGRISTGNFANEMNLEYDTFSACRAMSFMSILRKIVCQGIVPTGRPEEKEAHHSQ